MLSIKLALGLILAAIACVNSADLEILPSDLPIPVKGAEVAVKDSNLPSDEQEELIIVVKELYDSQLTIPQKALTFQLYLEDKYPTDYNNVVVEYHTAVFHHSYYIHFVITDRSKKHKLLAFGIQKEIM